MTLSPPQPRMIRSLPGRARVHVPDLSRRDIRAVEAHLRNLPGVNAVAANSTTDNLLVLYDAQRINDEAILGALRQIPEAPGVDHLAAEPRVQGEVASTGHAQAPRVISTGRGGQRRARIAVRGLERDAGLSQRLVERLERRPGVRARVNILTGRVLVEFHEHQQDIRELISEIADMELPDLPGEDNPTHPLDPAPLVQSATRTVGASLGLGILAARQVAGIQVSAPGAVGVASTLGILQGFPATRNGLRSLLGRNVADLVFGSSNIIALAFSGSLLGLITTAVESLRLLTEVLARRRAFHRYEAQLEDSADTSPGATIRLEAGERAPRAAKVIEGHGTASGPDGLPISAAPGVILPAGARLRGGPFMVELQDGESFVPQVRPVPPTPSLQDRYLNVLGPLSLAYAVGTAVFTRSFGRTFESLLLVNPRAALVGTEASGLSASDRVLRSGVIVVGTRPGRGVHLPDLLLLDSPRVLTDGVELTGVLPMNETLEMTEVQDIAAAVSGAAGSPWGPAFRASRQSIGEDGGFTDGVARGKVRERHYTLGPVREDENTPASERLRGQGGTLLTLRSEDGRALGLIALRPRLALGAPELIEVCRQHGVELALLRSGDSDVADAFAHRVGVALLSGDDLVAAVRARQAQGARVAVLSDNVEAAEAFEASDLAIGLTSGRSGRFAARADLLAPDLGAVAEIVTAAAARKVTVRNSVILSIAANIAGIVLGMSGGAGLARASIPVYVASLTALADGWLRLRGGKPPRSSVTRLADPRPERWGARNMDDVMKTLDSAPAGLTTFQATARQRAAPAKERRNGVGKTLLSQLASPLTGILAAGAAISFVLGSPLDAALILATVGVNVLAGAWQEGRAGQAADSLKQLSSASARVLRDGVTVTIPADQVVLGDVLLLASGDRVSADARLLGAQNLEVDEAALTGESLPVPKNPDAGTPEGRILLEGSDVTVGTGRAIVFAVGAGTRMGATAAALAASENELESSPLGTRLARLFHQIMPLIAGSGVIVVLSGLLRGQPLLPLLVVGTSVAVAAVPEGLPLLASMGEAAVARRLGKRQALVRRLGAVEALGRVDVACTDKTGTLTEGKLTLTHVADLDREARIDQGGARKLPPELRNVLLAAALASPHPEAPDANVQSTDAAVVAGAQAAGLREDLNAERTAELPFDPVRAFHVTHVGERAYVKGAPEVLLPRCRFVRQAGMDTVLDEVSCLALQDRAEGLAERGLRVLMITEGSSGDGLVEDPRGLVALGFVGISDPLRPGVSVAVERCHAAGIRVIMLTGDSATTARAIAAEANILTLDGEVLTGSDIAELHNSDLLRRLEKAVVVARVTPLDKLRIVESLQGGGHTVAMTGDGVNDAPALRLADVGVAMGRGGTEVARQAADMVLADDDFSTLVEALVEGRSFWRNIRRALGLLLGGNLGELGLFVGASVLGLGAPLVARQILAVNMITDALPALSVVLQKPENPDLSALAREGESALDRPLRNDVLRRGLSTALPALGAFAALLPFGLPQAQTVAFASIVTTQLAQTLMAGRVEGGLTRPVLSAVGGSAAMLALVLTVPVLRGALLLAAPTPLSWGLIALSAPAALLMSHLLAPFSQTGQVTPSLRLPASAPEERRVTLTATPAG